MQHRFESTPLLKLRNAKRYLCVMGSTLSNFHHTIVAIATPPGLGAIGIIRLSGPQAIHIVNQLFASKNLLAQPSHTLHVGLISFDGAVLDEVVVSLFKNPGSYTGEDVVEISCHGSAYVQEQVVQACVALGAQIAKPGEFTQRAFLNGKMDLTEAEAVAELIAASNNLQHQTSLHNLRGGFKKDLIHIREQLIEFSALMELELDFGEEDVAFADRTKFAELLQAASQKVAALINSFQLGNVVSNGIKVAIVGKPNAGKSTLLNALLNDDRALVSAIAGTTRDTIEEAINIEGITFHFIDTAGLRADGTDEIENMGMQKSRDKIEEAALIILLSDTPEPDEALLQSVQHKKHLIVINKIDAQTITHTNDAYLYISAKTKIGLAQLTKALYRKVLSEQISTEHTIITNTRHLQHLQKIQTHLADIQYGIDAHCSTDLIAPDIKLCLQEIGELTGSVTNEHVLDYVFSKFCIGK